MPKNCTLVLGIICLPPPSTAKHSLLLAWIRHLASSTGTGEAGYAQGPLMPWNHQLPKARGFDWASAQCKGNSEGPIPYPSSPLQVLLSAQACHQVHLQSCKDLFSGKGARFHVVVPGNRSVCGTEGVQSLYPGKENRNRQLLPEGWWDLK